MKSLLFRYLVCCLAVASLVACSLFPQKRGQLEKVAKDWSEVIRASQIIPVYPPTEDLQPGDLFLVQTTVDRQHELYRKQGFLPLDHHLGRMNHPDYSKFYKNSFETTAISPEDWRNSGWQASPIASFPSYAFQVNRSVGMDLALPVSGVPIGMGLLNTNDAFGSISLSNAHTYGVDINLMMERVDSWKQENSVLLANYASVGRSEESQNYLRVICRVYLVNSVDIVISDRSESGAEGAVSVPSPASLLTNTVSVNDVTKDVVGNAEKYVKGLEKINNQLGALVNEAGATTDKTVKKVSSKLPNTQLVAGLGMKGRVQVTAASSRTLALQEKFARPLVIGYLGFDMHIDQYGNLGPPLPTFAVLSERAEPEVYSGFSAESTEYIQTLERFMASKGSREFEAVLKEIDGNAAELYRLSRAQGGGKPEDQFRKLLANYMDAASNRNLARLKVQQAIKSQFNEGD